MNDGNNQSMQTILGRIDTLAQQGMGGVAPDDALESYIDKLMGEKDFPSIASELKPQFRKELIAKLKEYISAKDTTSRAKENFLTDTFEEFKNVYQGLISPPVLSMKAKPKKTSSFLPPAPVRDYLTGLGPPPPPAPLM